MPRIHGRKGRVYVAATAGAAASPLAFCNAWSFEVTSDRVDVTARGDQNRVYLARKPSIVGQFSGFYDDATSDLYTAAQSGVSKRFYLYPTTPSSGGGYFFGTALFGYESEGDVNGPVRVKGGWDADAFWHVGTQGGFTDGFSAGFDKGL